MTRGAQRVLLACSARLQPELTSAGVARRLLRDALTRTGRAEWMDSAELAIGEVVANAVLHAHTPIEVTLEVRSERVRVEVQDFNPSMPEPRDAGPAATTGRGMALVAALSLECGVRSTAPDGKVVWFEVGTGSAHDVAEEDLLAAWGTDADWGVPDRSSVDTVDVLLLGLPPTLWGAARQHHDALLRELLLYRAEHSETDVDLVLADSARGLVSSALRAMLDELPLIDSGHSLLPMVEKQTSTGIPAVDMTARIPRTLVPAYDALRHALDVAERLAGEGRLLVRPGLPEIVEVRNWVCGQIAGQHDGAAPTAWRGTAEARFETMAQTWASPSPPVWDEVVVRDSDRGVVAADDANRIVAISRSLADALGWEVDDLVGRRVVTLIPPELREAHVAGFSRHLNTGEAHALGVPLELPVLRRDNSRVVCRFMVEQAPANPGRSVYLAWIEPLV
jgi:PAS domain S-box-containing protein